MLSVVGASCAITLDHERRARLAIAVLRARGGVLDAVEALLQSAEPSGECDEQRGVVVTQAADDRDALG